MGELISVVIPAYNRRDIISKCVECVLNQTYSDIEVIIVDDGSTDKTSELIESFTDPRIVFLRYEENKGACFARNYGAAHANGEYIAFQDSDDLWLPEKLERQYQFLGEKRADLCFCGMIRSSGKESFYYPRVHFDIDGNMVEQLLTENVVGTQTILLKREVMENVKFDVSFKRFQDWDFILQVALKNYKLAYLNEPLVNSVLQDNSISVSVNTGIAYEHLYEKYKEEYEKYPRALASIYANLAQGFERTDKKKADYYYAKSLKIKWNTKVAAKRVLSVLNLR